MYTLYTRCALQQREIYLKNLFLVFILLNICYGAWNKTACTCQLRKNKKPLKKQLHLYVLHKQLKCADCFHHGGASNDRNVSLLKLIISLYDL